MPDQTSKLAEVNSPKVETLIVFISGRIERKNTFDGLTTYIVKCAAPTEYDHPATIVFRSENSNMNIGDTVQNVKTRLSGSPHKFTTRSGETIHSANMYLNEV